MKFPAPAKLNLFLHILAKRDDGYHELQTIFRFLDYADELEFVLREDGEITLCCSGLEIETNNNLALRAAHLLKPFCSDKRGVDIHLNKKIPIAAGLGGGSSDAATVLSVLNRQWGCHLSSEVLIELGRSLGTDIPAFLYGQDAWGEGIGDNLHQISLPDAWYLVWVPEQTILTHHLYADAELIRDCPPVKIEDYRSGNCCINVFESIIRKQYTKISELMDQLRFQLGTNTTVKLSGTGGSFFAEFADKQQAGQALQESPKEVFAFVAKADGKSNLMTCLEDGI